MSLTKATFSMITGASFNVLDYGADNTGTNDSSAAIQAAINAAGSSGGGMVYFPSGDYKLLSEVTIGYERVTLSGNNDAVIIISSLTNNGFVVGSSSSILALIIIDGLRFDRPTKSTDGAAIKIINTAYSTIKNCLFKNSRYGIQVKTHNDSLTIQNNTFLAGTYYGVYEYNINETWANDLTIRGNFFWHVEQAAIYMSGDGVGVSSIGDTYIEDNVIVASTSDGALQTQYGIQLVGVGSYNINISIQRNTFEGIALQTVYLTNMNRCRIEANYFSGTGTNDVGLYFGGGAGNSIISGNIFIGYNHPAAYIFSTGGITITGNNFTSDDTLGGNHAELELSDVVDCNITGNFFYCASSKYGIQLSQSGSGCNGILITSNKFTKASGNSNFVYDIFNNSYDSTRLIYNNLGNDYTSGAGTTTPASGSAIQWYAGDVIRNTAPSVLGTSGSQYVITGWICTAAGNPGTWQQQRVLTGT